jgi:hypothetical protein
MVSDLCDFHVTITLSPIYIMVYWHSFCLRFIRLYYCLFQLYFLPLKYVHVQHYVLANSVCGIPILAWLILTS